MPLFLIPLTLLLACPSSTRSKDTGETGEAQVPLDWGLVESCDETMRVDTLNDWYDASEAVLVYGDSDDDASLAEIVYGWYGDYIPSFELRAASDLSEEDRAKNLFVLGSPSTNPILSDLNGHLPAWFEDGVFTFGGYRYEEPGNGVNLVAPNPWASDRLVLVYAGNTLDGAYSLFTVWTGGEGYVTTRGRGTVSQQGDLCANGDPWGVVLDWGEDLRGDWDEWVAGLDSTETDHHTFYYGAGSEAAADMNWLAPWQEEEYARALDLLGVEALEVPIRTYLYADNDEKGEITGDEGNGHANDLNYEVHEVYGDGVYCVGAHEDVHVVAWHRIGETQYALMGEGLAVMVDGEWWGEDLESWVATFRDDGSLPSLRTLVEDFWSVDDVVTYPVAGHFVTWLAETRGMEEVKSLYLASDLEVAFQEELGLGLEDLEAEWLASVP